MANSTDIDWCGFRSKQHPADVMAALHSVFQTPQFVRFDGTGKGWNGYEQARRITYLHQPVGMVAFGGDSMKGWCQVNLTGDCMDHIAGDVAETLTQAVEDLGGQFKRVDIALTTKDASVSIETVRDAWKADGFVTGGRRPNLREIVSSQRTDGQTLYIGERTSPKYVRAYEKGYQLAKKFSLFLKAHKGGIEAECVTLDHVPVADIFRIEVEFKPDPDLFPADLMINRDSYFSGAYPYLAQLVTAKPDTFRLTAQRKAISELDAALMEMRRQWGDVLFTALVLHEGNITAIWDQIVGTKHSQTLLDAGVLNALKPEAVH